MATQVDAAAPKADEKPPAKLGKKKLGKKVFLLILLLVLPAGGAGGSYFLLTKKSTTKKVKPKPTIGPTMALDSFIVNLADEGGSRYLKLTIDLELGEALEDEVKRLMPRFRDRVLFHLSGLKMQDALRNETKVEIKKKMKEIAIEVFGKGAVKDFYLKEFVMQ